MPPMVSRTYLKFLLQNSMQSYPKKVGEPCSGHARLVVVKGAVKKLNVFRHFDWTAFKIPRIFVVIGPMVGPGLLQGGT